MSLWLGACASPVGVDETGFEPVFAALSDNVLTTGHPSATSRQLLAALGLAAAYQSDPAAALETLQGMASSSGRRRLFAVLAELHYARAADDESRGGFMAAAINAYTYIFCDELQPATDAYDPLFRQSCDIYNRSLARALLDDAGDVQIRNQVLETSLGTVEIVASLPGESWSEHAFERGKIPLVLVHGTASNPAVWAQLINGLNLDHELRARCQVVVAVYNTGTPVLLDAADVRAALERLVSELDPDGTDSSLQRMVIVGHSQGGLIARLLVSSSGERVWSGISDEPFDTRTR